MYRTSKPAILLATYQGQRYLRAQLTSLRSQTSGEWKAFMHDDGSSDNTVSMLREFAMEDPSHFCVIDAPPTGGAKNNFLFLTSQVEAPYYLYCDQDDVWLPHKIQRTTAAMLALEAEMGADRPCLVHTELRVVDGMLDMICPHLSEYQGIEPAQLTLARLLVQNTVTGCTMMINRTLRDEMLRPADPQAIRMHDWWAALIAMRFGGLRFLDEPSILYRQHGNNSVGAQSAKGFSALCKKAMDTQKIRQSIRETRAQAQEFARVFNLSEDDLITRYGHADEMNKLQRLHFYRKNGIQKTTTLRNLGFLLFG